MQCPFCGSKAVKNGKSTTGKQRYKCLAIVCSRTFQPEPPEYCQKISLTREEMLRVREEGMSLEEIARLAGVSRQRVHQILGDGLL